MSTLAPLDRTSAAIRPAGRAAGYHTWTDLLFVHWRVRPELLGPLLPRGLTLDTYGGSAWIGLVPFGMRNIRPWWSPPVPGVSNFLETNVRTYVHRDGSDPGVCFFSLDASSRLAVWLARRFWQLNYHHAQMSLVRRNGRISYRSRRTSPRSPSEICEIEAAIDQQQEPFAAIPGTLDHFLLERYVLYSSDLGADSARLYRGQVHHPPYRYVPARVTLCRESLLAANGILRTGEIAHAAYCPGVDVEIFPLARVS